MSSSSVLIAIVAHNGWLPIHVGWVDTCWLCKQRSPSSCVLVLFLHQPTCLILHFTSHYSFLPSAPFLSALLCILFICTTSSQWENKDYILLVCLCLPCCSCLKCAECDTLDSSFFLSCHDTLKQRARITQQASTMQHVEAFQLIMAAWDR